MPVDNKVKFSGKADAYAKYRPSYPDEFIRYVLVTAGTAAGDAAGNSNAVIADIGAGTGILTRRILEKGGSGIRMYAVEPNTEMLAKCVSYCSGYPGCTALEGSAENTGLPGRCADLVTAAQAFHWFDKVSAKIEFRRILKPGGKVILAWNRRDEDDPFISAYEELLKKICKGYKGTAGGMFDNSKSALEGFFADDSYETRIFDNSQDYTLESLKGYFMSTSYAPAADSPEWAKFDMALTELHGQYKNALGRILYRMNVFSYTGKV